MKNKISGFDYFIGIKKINEYQRLPARKRLEWLFYGNLLRMHYPKRIIELQNRFRKGEI